MTRFWVSYADDIGFRGLIITTARSPEEAVSRIKEAGKSPGGEAFVVELSDTEENHWPEDTLITKEQLKAAGYCSFHDVTEEALEEAIQRNRERTTLICAKHT